MRRTRPKFRHHAGKALVLFLCGGILYMLIEILWRGHTHWTMGVLGGLCFLLIGGLNNGMPWQMPLALQMVIGAAIVTAAEFAAGLILNVWLGLGIWDYSAMPGNIMGQICWQYSLAWLGLSLAAIILDDWLRYWLFGEPRPKYTIFRWERQEVPGGTAKIVATTVTPAKGHLEVKYPAQQEGDDNAYSDGAEHCCVCGCIIPEGRQVCPTCNEKYFRAKANMCSGKEGDRL